MTLTCVIRTTLLFEDSDSRSLTIHCLDTTQQLIYSLQSIIILYNVLQEPLEQFNSPNQFSSIVEFRYALHLEPSVLFQ